MSIAEETINSIVEAAACTGTIIALETISTYLKAILDLESTSENKHDPVDLLRILQHMLEQHVEELKKYPTTPHA